MLNSQAPTTTNTQIYPIRYGWPNERNSGGAFDEFILVFPPQISVKSHDLTEKKGSVVMRSLDFAYSSNLLTFVYTFPTFSNTKMFIHVDTKTTGYSLPGNLIMAIYDDFQ